MKVIEVHRDEGSIPAANEAVAVLNAGGLVVFPTETVYGIGADASQPEALERLRRVKDRDAQKAFTVHLSSLDEAVEFAPRLAGVAKRLIRKSWPGPLTIIAEVGDTEDTPVIRKFGESVRPAVYYEGSVGLRCPDEPTALMMLRGAKGPIVAASANRASRPAPSTASEAVAEVGDAVDIVLDSGATRYSKASTIVRAFEDRFEVLREGVFDRGSVERMARLRLLFVCTGNTCRSPMAELLAKRECAARLGCGIADLESKGIYISSAGVAAGAGGPSDGALEAMARRDLDLKGHRATPLSQDMVRQSDIVYAMTKSHQAAVRSLASDAESRTMLLCGSSDVPDPIGGDAGEYEQCASLIERGVAARIEEALA